MNSNFYWIYSNFHDENTKRIFEILPLHLHDHFYSLVQLADVGLKELYDLSDESDIDDEPYDPYIIMDNNREITYDADMCEGIN